MPGSGTHTLDRIDFYVAENTMIVQLDNLTLTIVPEPSVAMMLVFGAVAMLAGLRRRCK